MDLFSINIFFFFEKIGYFSLKFTQNIQPEADSSHRHLLMWIFKFSDTEKVQIEFYRNCNLTTIKYNGDVTVLVSWINLNFSPIFFFHRLLYITLESSSYNSCRDKAKTCSKPVTDQVFLIIRRLISTSKHLMLE